MPGVGDQRGRVDAPADDEFVPGHDLVARNADRGARDAPAQVRGGAVVDELADALIPGECRAGPDDDRTGILLDNQLVQADAESYRSVVAALRRIGFRKTSWRILLTGLRGVSANRNCAWAFAVPVGSR